MNKFSQQYCKPEQLLEDGLFFRGRIVTLYQRCFRSFKTDEYEFCKKIAAETGVNTFLKNQFAIISIEDPIRCPIHKFLDIITVAYQELLHKTIDIAYTSEITRIFQEEHMSYCINENGEVHLYLGEEFQKSRIQTLEALCETGSENLISCYKNTYNRLKPGKAYVPKAALRSLYECIEGLVKNITGEARLNSNAIDKLQEPILKHYGNQSNRRGYVKCKLAAMKDATQALHSFRHADENKEIFEPDIREIDLAFSSCSAFIRWILPVLNKH